MSRILVLDPQIDTAQTVCSTLSALGYGADMAVDGRSAIASATVRDYDWLFFVDALPDMDGFDCFQKLRRLRGQLRGVLLSDRADVRTVFEAVRFGVRRVLETPVTPEAVARLLLEEETEDFSPPGATTPIRQPSVKPSVRESQLKLLRASELRRVIRELGRPPAGVDLTSSEPGVLQRVAALMLRRATMA